MQTVKSAAVEPLMQAQWEERLAAYVPTGFEAQLMGAGGQQAIQYVSKLTTALLLLFGAYAVINNDLTVGALVAFNIANQTVQPILRLSQLWQDFQQVQVSVERLGDILNMPPERVHAISAVPPRPRGAIEVKHVLFRYRPGGPEVLKHMSVPIRAGEVVGIDLPEPDGPTNF
jgi:subfamily B ATP-binding cassette protein HlyB/CyaB